MNHVKYNHVSDINKPIKQQNRYAQHQNTYKIKVAMQNKSVRQSLGNTHYEQIVCNITETRLCPLVGHFWIRTTKRDKQSLPAHHQTSIRPRGLNSCTVYTVQAWENSRMFSLCKVKIRCQSNQTNKSVNAVTTTHLKFAQAKQTTVKWKSEFHKKYNQKDNETKRGKCKWIRGAIRQLNGTATKYQHFVYLNLVLIATCLYQRLVACDIHGVVVIFLVVRHLI